MMMLLSMILLKTFGRPIQYFKLFAESGGIYNMALFCKRIKQKTNLVNPLNILKGQLILMEFTN
jgi:hypothetical protein